MAETVVVVGAGHAGGHAVSTLRSVGFAGAIVLIGDEPYLPYERPPMSKQFLAGELEQERTYLKPEAYYGEKDIDLRLGTTATAIDRAAKTVALGSGAEVGYDKLLLATGSSVRRLDCPGADLAGIHYLRTIDDVLAIRRELKPGARLVIVGGGYIGLEVAAVAARAGAGVTVLEAQDMVMNRVVAPVVSEFYRRAHEAEGVTILTGTAVSAFEGPASGGGRAERVVCADGTVLEADLVVVGVGILPNTALAEAAGLDVDNGICVDEFARTADASVFAAGDATNHPNNLLGRRLRLESVQNAVSQATAAANAMYGEARAYEEVPWFWSDQYDLKLQIVGLSDPGDEVIVRGDPASGAFSAVYLRDGAVAALNAINNRRDFMHAKKLIAERRKVDAQALADPETPLKSL